MPWMLWCRVRYVACAASAALPFTSYEPVLQMEGINIAMMTVRDPTPSLRICVNNSFEQMRVMDIASAVEVIGHN